MTPLVRRWAGLALFLAVASVMACAVNPVTGARELSFFSERQEIELGRDADQDITRSLGLYEDETWQAYVQELGERMARTSERPHLPWTIRVLDDPVVNAFALPGGYLYVTRGILTHFGSEAELAGVLGHEIGHVTARHGVRQVTRAQLAQLGLGVGMILAPELQDFAGAAGAGLGLLFLRYGRDAERQADDLGLRYMTGQGYDPREMAATFEMLYNASGGAEGDRLPGWLSSHPDPLERRDRILQAVEEGRVSGDRTERESYLRRLEGMVFGEDPRQGFFRGSTYHHPTLAFRMDFPTGWTGVNQREAVQGVSPQEDAALNLTLATGATPRAALNAFLGQDGVTGSGVQERAVNGLPAASADFRATTQNGVLQGTVSFVEHDGRLYRLLGYAVESAWASRSTALRGAVGSFRRETDAEVLGAQPLRIRLVRIDGEMTLESFQARYPSDVSLTTLGTINGSRPGGILPAGSLVKRVTP